MRTALRAGGLSLQLRQDRAEGYIESALTSSNSGWQSGWFYLRNIGDDLPRYTGKIMMERPPHWYHGVAKKNVKKAVAAIEVVRRLRDFGLDVTGVIAAFHRRRVLPLAAGRSSSTRSDPTSKWRRGG